MTSPTPEVISLLQDLVAIDSVNPSLDPAGAGEGEIAEYIATWARHQDLPVEVVDDGDGRPSVLVHSQRPVPGDRALLLCGHLDTVSLDSVTDPLHPRIDGDRLYGRGSYDMKAGLAASLIACRDAARTGLTVRVTVAAVADEEHSSLGIRRVLDRLSADAAIVNEPTEMSIGVAHKGFAWIDIDIHGRAAHGSRPELGIDAIVKAGGLLTRLEQWGRDLGTWRHPLLGPATVHASVISGGQGPSTIPEDCRLTIERRTLPGEDRAQIEREVADLLAACADADPEFDAAAHTALYQPALETPVDHWIVGALLAARRGGEAAEVTTDAPAAKADAPAAADIDAPADIAGMSYWADSALIAAAGIPTVLFGPGGDGAHAEVEWVSISDTVDCARILLDVARSMETGRQP